MSAATFHVFNNRSYVDFYPIQFGTEVCEPLHAFGPTKINNYLFHYVISGKGTFFNTDAQTSHTLSAGQGFLIPPDVICSYQADQDDPWTYIWLEFNGAKTDHFIRRAGLVNPQLIFNSNQTVAESAVRREMTYILEHHHERSASLIGHLYLFANALTEESQTRAETPHRDITEFYIREAINYIERHFQSSMTIDEIAAHCNLNRNYFSRLFKEHMHLTPQQFLIQYRLSRACDLLKTTQLPLQDIAEAVGYTNQFNFSTAFKRQYNQSPSTWRKLNQ